MQKIILLLLVICLLASPSFSQDSKINKVIDDNGKTMKVKISGQSYGREFKYNNSFEVKGKTAAEKDSIVNNVINVLNLDALKEANKKYRINKSIEDDGEIMMVRIAGHAYGRDVEFMQRFEVMGMGRDLKDGIVNRLMDSLKVSYKPAIDRKPPPPPKKARKKK